MQDDPEYREWIERNEPDDLELEHQRGQAANLAYRPLISILTPVYNTPVPILDATIRSVLGQTYDHWELCLADGNSTDPRVREALRAWEGRDPRIRVEFLAENRGISGNSNAALAMARGEFVALLDHDDLLAPPALFENASLLNRHPEADFLYSDRDLISEDGTRRFLPFFKPEWSPEVMLTANYLTHLCVFRTRLAREVGGFDPATDGAQDWDLFLRLTERSRGIFHIPKVLYHWRYWSRSTATGVDAKPYAQEGQRRTLESHYKRQGISGDVECLPSGFARIRAREEAPCRVSIIVAADRGTGLWPRCVGRLLARTRYDDFEVIVIEGHAGGPQRRGAATVARDPRVRVLAEPGAPGSPASLNLAARRASGDALLFFSERLVVDSPDWLSEMAHLLERPAIGAVGAKLLQVDGTLHHAGLVVGLDGLIGRPYAGAPDGYVGILGHTEWYRNYLAVSGDCLLIPRDLFDAIGGFDEHYRGPRRGRRPLPPRVGARASRRLYAVRETLAPGAVGRDPRMARPRSRPLAGALRADPRRGRPILPPPCVAVLGRPDARRVGTRRGRRSPPESAGVRSKHELTAFLKNARLPPLAGTGDHHPGWMRRVKPVGTTKNVGPSRVPETAHPPASGVKDEDRS